MKLKEPEKRFEKFKNYLRKERRISEETIENLISGIEKFIFAIENFTEEEKGGANRVARVPEFYLLLEKLSELEGVPFYNYYGYSKGTGYWFEDVVVEIGENSGE